ncbi:hypothetical protein M440DRAFT_1419976 [Trichoderma longibrachiatum ATCC 18648]|uniref:GATA-type domain-containing protein n=1 Tax=Trichoderma longibrachiatum ATCC 18648 TaxID=983965 RepID=A0A2T4CDJ6_TRILO|nr:hypothetical protein M440DRAFT_1419976 [Trichoderma longibrachiatum ATCC 18648]
MTWRCSHCRTWGTSVWAVRDGPAGPKSLCANCGYFYERDRRLPRQTKNLHLQDIRANSNLSSLILALSLLGGPADSTGGTSHWKLNARRLAIV